MEHYLASVFGYNVHLLDINPAALKEHKKIHQNRSVNRGEIVGDAVAVPFAADSFGLVLSFDLLEHLPDESIAARVIEECRRVLKSDGSMFHKVTVTEEVDAMYGDDTHHICWSSEEWSGWFKDLGFETTRETSHRIPIWSRTRVGLYPVEGAFYLKDTV